jgi:hypothetical protein
VNGPLLGERRYWTRPAMDTPQAVTLGARCPMHGHLRRCSVRISGRSWRTSDASTAASSPFKGLPAQDGHLGCSSLRIEAMAACSIAAERLSKPTGCTSFAIRVNPMAR